MSVHQKVTKRNVLFAKRKPHPTRNLVLGGLGLDCVGCGAHSYAKCPYYCKVEPLWHLERSSRRREQLITTAHRCAHPPARVCGGRPRHTVQRAGTAPRAQSACTEHGTRDIRLRSSHSAQRCQRSIVVTSLLSPPVKECQNTTLWSCCKTYDGHVCETFL